MDRQLNLFKGKRQRGVKPKPAKEFSTQCALADLIELNVLPGWEWTHLPFGEHRSKVTGARLKRMGTKRGWPDLIFSHIDGTICFLELKRKGETPSEHQERIAAHLIEAGHRYYWTDDFKDAVRQLIEWKILRNVATW